MSILDGFSEPIELPNIPDEPGVAILQDQRGETLEVVEATNIRRRVGELLDSTGGYASQGPRVYSAQQQGTRIFVRWKLTGDHKAGKQRLTDALDPKWPSEST